MNNDSYTAQGVITNIYEEQMIREDLKKRKFVIRSNSKYGNKMAFDLMGEKTDLISYYSEGQEIEVLFNISSNESKDGEKWFNNLTAFSIKPIN